MNSLLQWLIWCLLLAVNDQANGYSPSILVRQNGPPSNLLLWMATSSSDLKKSKNNNNGCGSDNPSSKKASKYPRNSVVSRLKQAVERASAAAAKKEQAKTKQQEQQQAAAAAAAATISGRNNQMDHHPYDELPSDPYYYNNYYDDNSLSSYYYHDTIKSTQPQIPAVPKEEGTILELMTMIDQLLIESSSQQQQMNAWQHQRSLFPVRDSMTAILMHNDRVNNTASTTTMLLTASSSSSSSASIGPTTCLLDRKVAIVLCKPLLMEGKYLSFEQDVRIRRLVQAIQDQEFLPDLVVFVGSNSSTKSMEHFQTILQHNHDANRNDISSSSSSSTIINPYRRPKCIADNTSPSDGGGFDMIGRYCQADLERMIQRRMKEGQHPLPQRGRVTVQIQFALVSADYHLCVLHDIHTRSPNQSVLRCLEHWELETDCTSSTTTTTNNHYNPGLDTTCAPRKIIVESSWLYLYAATAGLRYNTNNNTNNDDEEEEEDTYSAQFLCTTWYRRVQELIPVLMNLRAVSANREFFQRDNYRALVQVRRSFITDIEELYHETTKLAQVRKHLVISLSTPIPNNDNNNNHHHHNNHHKKPLDIVLEGALLSLGRCSDLVRPAGLLTGSVALEDFRRAVTLLENAIGQITLACDPDRPYDYSLPNV